MFRVPADHVACKVCHQVRVFFWNRPLIMIIAYLGMYWGSFMESLMQRLERECGAPAVRGLVLIKPGRRIVQGHKHLELATPVLRTELCNYQTAAPCAPPRKLFVLSGLQA